MTTTPKTYSAYLKQITLLQAQAEIVRKRESAGVIKRINEAMAAYGLKPSDFLAPNTKPPAKPAVTKSEPQKKPAPAKKVVKPATSKPHPLKGVLRPPKYSDGQGRTWAGGGSIPLWLREQLEQGRPLTDFQIKPESKPDESQQDAA